MVQVHLGPRFCGRQLQKIPREGIAVVKKFLVVGVIAVGAYLIYRQVKASRAEEDLWTEATAAPDLGASFDAPAQVDEVVEVTKVDGS